jgi:hypothetical protein
MQGPVVAFHQTFGAIRRLHDLQATTGEAGDQHNLRAWDRFRNRIKDLPKGQAFAIGGLDEGADFGRGRRYVGFGHNWSTVSCDWGSREWKISLFRIYPNFFPSLKKYYETRNF